MKIAIVLNFIGLIFYTAVSVSNYENVNKIFGTGRNGAEIFLCNE